MIGAPNTQESEATTHGTATVTNVTPENLPNLLDRVSENGTLNPGAPGRRDPGTLQELRSAGVSGADNGALLVATGAEAHERSAAGTWNLDAVKERSVITEEDTDVASDVACDLPYFDREALDRSMNSRNSLRNYLRKMSALWPDATVEQLAVNIYNLLENSGIGAASVICILRGRLVNKKTQLSDLRVVLRGEGVMRPGRPGTHKRKLQYSVTTQQMQYIGRLLMANKGDTEIAKLVGCDRDLVRSVEDLFRLRIGYRQALKAAALEAAATGESIRGFAKKHGITKSKSERMLNKAKYLHKQKEAAQCLLSQDQSQWPS